MENGLKPTDGACIFNWEQEERRRTMSFLTAHSSRIVLVSLVAVGAVRVVFPDAGRANPAGDADEVTAACSRPEWTLTFVDRDVIDADSYGSSTAIFIDSRDRPNLIYAKGPIGVDD